MKIEITKEMLGIGGAIAAAVAGIGGIVAAVSTSRKARKEVEEMREEMEDQKKDIQKELESQTRALNNMIHTVNASVEELSRKTEIEISDDILSRAIDKAARDAADEASREAIKLIKADMHQIIEEKVTNLVHDIEPAAKSEIRKTWQKKVNQINVYNMKLEIEREVKKEILDKLQTEVYNKAKTEVDLITSSFANQVNQQAEFIKAMNAKMNAAS